MHCLAEAQVDIRFDIRHLIRHSMVDSTFVVRLMIKHHHHVSVYTCKPTRYVLCDVLCDAALLPDVTDVVLCNTCPSDQIKGDTLITPAAEKKNLVSRYGL